MKLSLLKQYMVAATISLTLPIAAQNASDSAASDLTSDKWETFKCENHEGFDKGSPNFDEYAKFQRRNCFRCGQSETFEDANHPLNEEYARFAQNNCNFQCSDPGALKNLNGMNPEELNTYSEEQLAKMEESLSRLVRLQRVSRQQKDIIKLNCVNDKLLQLKQLLNIGDNAKTSLIEARAKGDGEGSNHYASQIQTASNKVCFLRDEAEACVGEEMAFLGDTEVTVEGGNELDDPTSNVGNLGDPHGDRIIEPPAYASPFL